MTAVVRGHQAHEHPRADEAQGDDRRILEQVVDAHRDERGVDGDEEADRGGVRVQAATHDGLLELPEYRFSSPEEALDANWKFLLANDLTPVEEGVLRVRISARDAAWPDIFRAGLMPVSCGLVLATSLIIAMAANQSLAAWLLMGVSTALTFFTRIHPLWLLAVGGVAGLFGLL